MSRHASGAGFSSACQLTNEPVDGYISVYTVAFPDTEPRHS